MSVLGLKGSGGLSKEREASLALNGQRKTADCQCWLESLRERSYNNSLVGFNSMGLQLCDR